MSWRDVFGSSRTPRRNGANGDADTNEVLVEPEELLEAHRARLNALRLESGYQASQFDRLIGTAVRQVADSVYLLPATRVEHHCESGGLLRLAVETACLAFRRTDGKFLAGSSAGDVHYRERDRVWRYTAFLGGLLRPVGRSLTHVAVTSSDGVRWDPLQEPLWNWLRRTSTRRVEIVWRTGTDGRPTAAASLWIASRIISPGTLKYLHDADGRLTEALLSLAQGGREGRLCEIVEEAYQSAIDSDLSAHPQGTHDRVAVALEHRLLEVLRALAREKWTMNTPGGRLWTTTDGVFVAWKTAANEILVRLKGAGIEGVPRDPDTLAEILVAQGVLASNPAASCGPKHYYSLLPHLRGVPKLAIDVVKLADPSLLGLHLEGVERIDASCTAAPTEPKSDVADASPPDPLQLPLSVPICNEPDKEASRTNADDIALRTGNSAEQGDRLESLTRFGTAGRILRRLGERLMVDGNDPHVKLTQEGLAVDIPEGVAPYCENPKEFLESCEAQSLLVPSRPGTHRFLRPRATNGSRPAQAYVVLAPRIARHFTFLTGTDV